MRCCTFPRCERRHRARGLCDMHYLQWHRCGIVFPFREPPGAAPLPFAELERHIAARYPCDLRFNQGAQRLATDGMIARLVGVDRRTVFRWRQAGTLRLAAAERVADTLGDHPACIWRGYLDALTLAADAELHGAPSDAPDKLGRRLKAVS